MGCWSDRIDLVYQYLGCLSHYISLLVRFFVCGKPTYSSQLTHQSIAGYIVGKPARHLTISTFTEVTLRQYSVSFYL